MQFIINIDKKRFYTILFLVLVTMSFFMASSNDVSEFLPWHYLQQIAVGPSDKNNLTSVDSNKDGMVDWANNATYAQKVRYIENCNLGDEGALRYNPGTKTIEFCDGTKWGSLSTIDNSPSPFSFVDNLSAKLDSVVVSDPVILNGFESAIANISGEGNPQIRCNGGEWSDSCEVFDGQYIEARLTSSSNNDLTRTATIFVGNVFDIWEVKTKPLVTTYLFEEDASFEVPSWCSSIAVHVVGAGGGGGGSCDHSSAGGGGGGAGAYVKKTISVTPGEIIQVTIGLGGTGGASAYSGFPGTDGSSTYFGSYVVAQGGKGGQPGTHNGEGLTGAGGLGGVASGGDINIGGDTGQGSIYNVGLVMSGGTAHGFYEGQGGESTYENGIRTPADGVRGGGGSGGGEYNQPPNDIGGNGGNGYIYLELE